MKGSPDVIATLQDAVAREASINEQYRLDERSLKYLGLKKLKEQIQCFGNDTSNWRRAVLDRIYFLGASPSYTIAAPVEQTTVTTMFQSELALEMSIVAPYEKAVAIATKALDDTTRNMYEHWLKWHEEHVAWFEKQLRVIAALGEPLYLNKKL